MTGMVQGWYCALLGLNPQNVIFYSVLPVLPVLRMLRRRLTERDAGRSERARRPATSAAPVSVWRPPIGPTPASR
ncbi:hypothetical protein AQI96_08260 [Streptomyces canus]|nr:hypothetical protein AQI96_08260 [Streptomyces canus]